jgi:hypothetical protein
MFGKLRAVLVLAGACPLLMTAAVVNCTGSSPTSVVGFGQDDWNTSTLTQCNATFITQGSTVGGSDWITTALGGRNFNLANGWDITYAGAADPGSHSSNYTLNTYQAWVVNEPGGTNPDGTAFAGRPQFQNIDAGGAVFIMSYDSIDDFAPITGIHFIQAYRQSLNGGAFTIHLDVPAAQTNPYYDTGGVHGTAPGHPTSYWMRDRPLDCENQADCTAEGIEDYHTDVQFNVLMAADFGVEGAGDPHPGAEKIVLYGGYGWGYQYTTNDLFSPEPSFTLLAGGLMAAMAGLKRMRRK